MVAMILKTRGRDGLAKRPSVNLAVQIHACGRRRYFIEGQPSPLATLPTLQKLPRDAFQKCRERAALRIEFRSVMN
jgi:hypothetical protein